MVVLDESELKTRLVPVGAVVNFGEKPSSVAVLLRRHDLDRWNRRIFNLHQAPRRFDWPPRVSSARRRRSPPSRIVLVLGAMCRVEAPRSCRALDKTMDIFLTNRPARVTVFQNEAARLRSRFSWAPRDLRLWRSAEGTTRKWRRKSLESLKTDSEMAISPVPVVGNYNRTPNHSRACANFWNARARCDRASEPSRGIPCFSCELISPKVRSWPSGRKIGSSPNPA